MIKLSNEGGGEGVSTLTLTLLDPDTRSPQMKISRSGIYEPILLMWL